MNIDLFSTFQYLSSPVFYVVSLLSLYFRHFWQVDNWWIRRDSINTSFYIIPIRHFEVIYLVQAMKSFLAKEDINAVRSFKLPNLVIAMATPLIFHFILKWSKIWHALLSEKLCKIIDISDKITLKWQQTVTRREQTIYPRELSKVSEFSRTFTSKQTDEIFN